MVALLLALACSSPNPAGSPSAPGEPAVEPQPKGVSVTPIAASELATLLAAPSDRARVVNFWATWCHPCVEELPRLRDWAHDTEHVELILVDVDLFTLRKAKVEPFLSANDLGAFTNYQLSDKDPAIALEQSIPEFKSVVPFTLVIPASGGIDRTALLGSIQISQLEAAIASL